MFWWVQVDLAAASQPAGALASFWPSRQSPARPAVPSRHGYRFYVSSDWCPLPSPPGTRSLWSQAAGRGSDESGRLNSNKTYQVEERVYIIVHTDTVTIFCVGLSYLRITTTFQFKNLFVWLSLHSWDAAIQYMLSDINLPQRQKPEALQTLKLRHSQPPVN